MPAAREEDSTVYARHWSRGSVFIIFSNITVSLSIRYFVAPIKQMKKSKVTEG